jgi:hypothetical protein
MPKALVLERSSRLAPVIRLEEVGHWLPKCSGLLTPVGSDEPFQAKILFAVHFIIPKFI